MSLYRLLNTSKTAQAIGLKSIADSTYIAIGRGNPTWNDTVQEDKTFVNDTFVINLTLAFADNVQVFVQGDLLSPYTLGLDYLYNIDNGTVTRIPTGSIPADATVTITYKAVGVVTANQSALVDEIARRKCSLDYAELDPLGPFTINGNKYSTTQTPTDLLIASIEFPAGELSGEVIREAALFFNVVPVLTEFTVNRTFASDLITIDLDVENSFKTAENVVIQSTDLLSTYLIDVDYIIDKNTSKVHRLESGSIAVGQEVTVTYDKINSELLLSADVSDGGIMYLAKTALEINKPTTVGYTETFLVRLTR
ncbi:hypothetical protein [Cognatishimia sp.]|uniref:hypothetical protein n=1 Tax=Cognatishimia sp. TaxID=2211648 RepID=UPI0035166AB1|nr:hypothetical protein [Cognatishimia sp.]